MYASANGCRLADLRAIKSHADFEAGHTDDLSIAAAAAHVFNDVCRAVPCVRCSVISQPAYGLQTARLAAG